MKKENGSNTQLDLELFSSALGKRFSKFHTENPHVYTELVALARQFKRKNPYSRMIMEREIDLEGIFNVKTSVADSENLFYV